MLLASHYFLPHYFRYSSAIYGSVTVDDYESAHVRMESAWRVHYFTGVCAVQERVRFFVV